MYIILTKWNIEWAFGGLHQTLSGLRRTFDPGLSNEDFQAIVKLWLYLF